MYDCLADLRGDGTIETQKLSVGSDSEDYEGMTWHVRRVAWSSEGVFALHRADDDLLALSRGCIAVSIGTSPAVVAIFASLWRRGLGDSGQRSSLQTFVVEAFVVTLSVFRVQILPLVSRTISAAACQQRQLPLGLHH